MGRSITERKQDNSNNHEHRRPNQTLKNLHNGEASASKRLDPETINQETETRGTEWSMKRDCYSSLKKVREWRGEREQNQKRVTRLEEYNEERGKDGFFL